MKIITILQFSKHFGVLLATVTIAAGFAGVADASLPISPQGQLVGSPTGSGVKAQTSYTGTLPLWAQMGASLDIYQISNLSLLSPGNTDSFSYIETEQVSGPTFQVSLNANGNFQFVLQSGSNSAEMFTSTNGEATLQGLETSKNLAKIRSPWVNTLNRSLKYPKTTTTVPPPGPATCVATLLSTTETMSKVGEAHTAANVSATFSYGTTNSTEFTLGLSLTGANGTFSASGTYTIEGGSTVFMAVPPSAHEFITVGFYVGYYREDCPAVRGVIKTYLTTPYALTGKTGDLGQTSAPTNPLGYCPTPPSEYLMPGKSLGISYGSAFSASAAFSLFGFTFGITQHWGTDATITYYSGVNSTVSYLCGPGGGIPAGSPVVYDSTRNS